MKFVIVSPRQVCGGPIVLHNLCKLLCELGYDARVFYGVTQRRSGKRIKNPNLRVAWQRVSFLTKDAAKSLVARVIGPKRASRIGWLNGYADISVKGCRRKWLPFVDDDTIVVYPEIAYGNYLRAKNVVRWLLYFNQFPDEESQAYGDNDLFYCYRPIFNDSKLNPGRRVLKTPYFDLNLYRRYNFGERSGTCYVIRKGASRPDLPEHFDGVVVDNLSEREKVDVFNSCEFCVSYDMQTAYSQIAALCGCLSIKVLEPGKTKEDYLGEGDGDMGVAFGFEEEEIARALRTAGMIATKHERLNRTSLENAATFAKDCAEYFGLEEL